MSALNQPKTSPTAHSATVTMSLHAGSRTYRVVQAGPDAIKLQTPQPIPPGDAMLEIIVDGRPHRQPIRVLSANTCMQWVSIADQ